MLLNKLKCTRDYKTRHALEKRRSVHQTSLSAICIHPDRGFAWVVGPRSHKYRLRPHRLPCVSPLMRTALGARLRLRLRLCAILLAHRGQRGIGLGGEVHGPRDGGERVEEWPQPQAHLLDWQMYTVNRKPPLANAWRSAERRAKHAAVVSMGLALTLTLTLTLTPTLTLTLTNGSSPARS